MIIVGIMSMAEICFAQHDASRTKLVAGIAGPELIHAGLTWRAANVSLLGLSAGVGPSFGTAWTTVSFEHRLYLGNPGQASQKVWFFRQGVTWFPVETESSRDITINLTGGKDFFFRNSKNGITIDAGVFYLPDSGNSSIILVRSWNLWPAMRFQLNFSL
jgi:hypothetical protein